MKTKVAIAEEEAFQTFTLEVNFESAEEVMVLMNRLNAHLDEVKKMYVDSGYSDYYYVGEEADNDVSWRLWKLLKDQLGD